MDSNIIIEKINKHINFADRVLGGGERGGDVAYMLSRASESLNKISDVVPGAAPLAEKLMEMSYDVADIAAACEIHAERFQQIGLEFAVVLQQRAEALAAEAEHAL